MNLTRSTARRLIIRAANRHRLHLEAITGPLRPYNERRINQAVHKCRGYALVKPPVLVAAGFNERGPNWRALK